MQWYGIGEQYNTVNEVIPRSTRYSMAKLQYEKYYNTYHRVSYGCMHIAMSNDKINNGYSIIIIQLKIYILTVG